MDEDVKEPKDPNPDADPFELLREPFPSVDLSWRVQSAGTGQRGLWARVVPYIDARLIQDRFDKLFGPAGWTNAVRREDHALFCGIGLRHPETGEWVWKWDGTSIEDESDGFADPTKAALTGGFRRVSVLWGVGRYMYEVESDFAKIHENGKFYQPKSPPKARSQYPEFRWDPPALPPWAIPQWEREQREARRIEQRTNGEPSLDELVKDVETKLEAVAAELTTEQVDRVQEAITARDRSLLNPTLDWLKSKGAS